MATKEQMSEYIKGLPSEQIEKIKSLDVEKQKVFISRLNEKLDKTKSVSFPQSVSKKQSPMKTISRAVGGMFSEPVTVSPEDIGGVGMGFITGATQGIAPAVSQAIDTFRSGSASELLNRAASGGNVLGAMRAGINLVDKNNIKEYPSFYPQAITPKGKLQQFLAESAGGLATGNIANAFSSFNKASPVKKALSEADPLLRASYRKTAEIEIPKIKERISSVNADQKRYEEIANEFKSFREKAIKSDVSRKGYEAGVESQAELQNLNKAKNQINQSSGNATQGIVSQAKNDAKKLALAGRETYKQLNKDLSDRFEQAVSPYLTKQISAEEASDLIRSSFDDAGIDLNDLEGAEKVLKNQLDKIESMIGGKPEKVLDAIGGVSYSKPTSGSVSLGELYQTLKSLKTKWGSKFKSGDRVSAAFNKKLMEKFPEFKDVRSSFSDEYTQMNRLADIFDPYNIDRSYDIDKPYNKILSWSQKGIDPNDADIADVISKKFPKGFLDSPQRAKSSLDKIRLEKQNALNELNNKKIGIDVSKKQTQRQLKIEQDAKLSELNSKILDKVDKFIGKSGQDIASLKSELTSKEKSQMVKESFIRYLQNQKQKGNLERNLFRKAIGIVVDLSRGGISPYGAEKIFDEISRRN